MGLNLKKRWKKHKRDIMLGVVSPWALAYKKAAESNNETVSMIADPLDILGNRAERARDEASKTLEESAAKGISSLKDQNAIIEQLYKPFYDTAVGGLSSLQGMISGGKMPEGYQPSKLYEYQKEMGERNINRGMAARGGYGSSARKMKLASLYGDLGVEEANRAYSDVMQGVQMGTGAANTLSGANTGMANNVGSLYGNLGASEGQLSQMYGASRQSAFQGLSNSLMGLSMYLGQKGV